VTPLRILLATLWLAALGASAANCVVTVRMDDVPPYLMTIGDGKPGGLSADVALAALDRIGCQAEFRNMPFARAIKSLQTGELGLLTDIFQTPEREEFILYSQVPLDMPNVLYVRREDRGRWPIKSLADFPRLGIHLGMTRGALFSAEQQSEANSPEFHAIVEEVSNHQSQWRMLAEKRVDAVICDPLVADWDLRRMHLDDQIVRDKFVTGTQPSYFGFSRKLVSEDFVARFDAAFRDMLKDGTVAKILEKYGLSQKVVYKQD
jgi:polar amino acid transport system substrate-binding protein